MFLTKILLRKKIPPYYVPKKNATLYSTAQTGYTYTVAHARDNKTKELLPIVTKMYDPILKDYCFFVTELKPRKSPFKPPLIESSYAVEKANDIWDIMTRDEKESNFESRRRYLLSLKKMTLKTTKIKMYQTKYELSGILECVDPNSTAIVLENLETKTGIVKQCRIRLSDVLMFKTDI